jgi:hypothetical protein
MERQTGSLDRRKHAPDETWAAQSPGSVSDQYIVEPLVAHPGTDALRCVPAAM